jgi:hypothetical protein
VSLSAHRRLDDEAEASVRRLSIVKLLSTIVIVWAVGLLAFVVIGFATG